MSLDVKQFEIGPMQNFCYLIADAASKEALVVDPAWAPQKIKEMAESNGYRIKGLVVTHAHFDHTNAIEEILKDLDVPVYANRAEIPYAKSGLSIVGSLGKTVRPMDGGEKVKLGESEIQFLHTPGHTPGSQCVLAENQLITGDTLFIGGCGRSDLPGGDPVLLYQSLRKISSLPEDLEVCPGHDYGQTRRRKLKEELAENPYLKMKDENTFIHSVS